jgi:hypothetical protein
MSWVTVAVGASSALSQINAGKYAKGQSDLQAQQSEYQAAAEQKAALNTAAIIRRAGRRQLGQATAAYASAGVQVGEGSAGEVERQITQDVEHDAFQTILQGDRRALGLRTDATLMRIDGKSKETAGYVNAVGTLLSTGAQAYGGWKTRQGAGSSYSYNNDADGMSYSRTGADIRGRR